MIFKAPLFEGHGVRNWASSPTGADFTGTDTYGFGMHDKGVIDCVNVCDRTTPYTQGIDFLTLWANEHNLKEGAMLEHDILEAYTAFLHRMIVRIRIPVTNVQFIPDPTVWLVRVQIEQGHIALHGTIGALVLRDDANKGVVNITNRRFKTRTGPWDDT
jgi:hypothetical protein